MDALSHHPIRIPSCLLRLLQTGASGPARFVVRTVKTASRNGLKIVLMLALFVFAACSTAVAQEEPTPSDGADGPTPVTVEEPQEGTGTGTASAQQKSGGIPIHPLEIMSAMRWWLVPFVIASFIAVWFGIERIVVLRRSRVIPKPFVERFLQHLEQGKLDQKTALKLCEQSDSPVSAVFAHGVRKWGKPSVEVEQAIIDGGEREVGQLRKHLRVLNGVATVTPLIGLLGTVWGMIEAFNDIAQSGAMGKADELAGGIALALLTTAFGLAIAIPSLIMYMYLAGRVDALVIEMDVLSQDVVHLISAEGLSGQVASKRSSSRSESKEAG